MVIRSEHQGISEYRSNTSKRLPRAQLEPRLIIKRVSIKKEGRKIAAGDRVMENIGDGSGTLGATEKEATIKPRRLKSSDKPPPESHREYLDLDTDEEEFGHQETPEPQEEAPAEPDKPSYDEEVLSKLVQKAKDLGWTESDEELLREFFLEPDNRLLLRCAPRTSGVTYFARSEHRQIYADAREFARTVTFGCFSGCTVANYIYRLTNQLYAPLAFQKSEGCWPRVSRERILNNLNDFVAESLDSSFYRPLGLLLLYVPACGRGELSTATSCLHAYSRLEKVANGWLKRIREVLRIKAEPVDLSGAYELHGLKDEFDFWLARYDNLSAISRQLRKNRDLGTIVEVLRRAKSTCVCRLKLIQKELEHAQLEASSNLAYLDVLLRNSTTNGIKSYAGISRVLYLIVAVSKESPYYGRKENLKRLVGAFGAEVVKACGSDFEPKSVFDQPEKCKKQLLSSLSLCSFFSAMLGIVLFDDKEEERRKLTKDVYNFEGRCRDVVEICEAVLTFSSLSKISLGGTKGRVYEAKYKRMIDKFVALLNSRIKHRGINNALDVTKVEWLNRDMLEYRQSLGQLVGTVFAIFNDLFDYALRLHRSLDIALETLHTLLKFINLHGFPDFIQTKWIQVWKVYIGEMDKCLSLVSYNPRDEYLSEKAAGDSEEIDEKMRSCGNRKKLVQDDIKRLCCAAGHQDGLLLVNHHYDDYDDDDHELKANKKYLDTLKKKMLNASDWLGPSANCTDSLFCI